LPVIVKDYLVLESHHTLAEFTWVSPLNDPDPRHARMSLDQTFRAGRERAMTGKYPGPPSARLPASTKALGEPVRCSCGDDGNSGQDELFAGAEAHLTVICDALAAVTDAVDLRSVTLSVAGRRVATRRARIADRF
jgi:hypothetical protein